MVAPHSVFLIDSTFIFKRIIETFHETPLLINKNGQDQTRLYGFLRDLLRLYVTLNISYGVVVIGKEVTSIAPREDIDSVVEMINLMNIPLLLQLDQDILNICTTISHQFTHLVCDNKGLLQLTNDNIKIIMPSKQESYIEISSQDIFFNLGVKPNEIPTFLALSGSSGKRKASIDLTERQTIKLIKSYGNLESIFRNFSEIKNNAIRNKLDLNKKIIFSRYSKLQKNKTKSLFSFIVDNCKWALSNDNSKKILQSNGFFSLQPLLELPKGKKVEQ